MTHTFKVRLCSFAMAATALAFYQSVTASRAALQNERSQTIAKIEAYNLSVNGTAQGTETPAWADGTYQGEGQGFAGKIELSVTVEGGQITNIEVAGNVSDDAAYFNQAKSLLDTIIAKQTPQVDTVSGATFSSKGLIQAVQDALGKAVE